MLSHVSVLSTVLFKALASHILSQNLVWNVYITEPLLDGTKDPSKTQTTALFVSSEQYTFPWRHPLTLAHELYDHYLWPLLTIITHKHCLGNSLWLLLTRTIDGDQYPWLSLWSSPITITMTITNNHCLWPSPVTIIHDDYLWLSSMIILMTIPLDHCSWPSPMTFTHDFHYNFLPQPSPWPSPAIIMYDHHSWPSVWPPVTITMTTGHDCRSVHCGIELPPF